MISQFQLKFICSCFALFFIEKSKQNKSKEIFFNFQTKNTLKRLLLTDEISFLVRRDEFDDYLYISNFSHEILDYRLGDSRLMSSFIWQQV